MGDIVVGVFCLLLGVGCAVLSLFQFLEKGVPLNNAYLWASESQRRGLDLPALFRQSAITLALAAVLMLLIGAECLLHTDVLLIFVGPVTLATLLYVILSSVRMARRR